MARMECNPEENGYKDTVWVMYIQTQLYTFVSQSTPGKLF